MQKLLCKNYRITELLMFEKTFKIIEYDAPGFYEIK